MRDDTRKILTVATGGAGQVVISAGAALATTLFLPVADRGRYVLLITVIAVSVPLAGLGSNVGLRRARPSHPSPQSLEKAYFRLSFVCASMYALLAPLIVWVITGGEIPRGLTQITAVFVLAFTQVLGWQFVDFWYSRFQFRVGVTYATINASASLIAAAWAAASPSFTEVVAVQAIASTIMQVVQALHVWNQRSSTTSSEVNLRSIAASLIRTGSPSLVMTAGMSLTFRLDRLILGALSGPQSVAVYALAGSFSELPRIIPAAFGQIANGHAASVRNRLKLRPYLLPSTLFSCVGAIGAGLVGVLVMSNIDRTYRESIAPLGVLLIAELALVPYSIIVRMIIGGGRVKLSAAIGLIAIALSGAIYWLAIARFGVMGAAWASLVIYAGVSVACLLIHHRQQEAAV